MESFQSLKPWKIMCLSTVKYRYSEKLEFAPVQKNSFFFLPALLFTKCHYMHVP